VLRLIHAGDLAHDHHRIFVSSQYFPDWRTHLRRGEDRGRYLIKERLKNMMVRPIDKNDFDRRFPKGFCRSQPAEAPADNHYARDVRIPGVGFIYRDDIGVPHCSVSVSHLFLKILQAGISGNLPVLLI
jgi:hypothetical protein